MLNNSEQMLPLKYFLLNSYKLLLIVFVLRLCAAEAKAQGLQFNSNDSLVAKRTSFNVFSSEHPEFKDHLFIDFDLSVWDTSNLGYILNLAEKNNSYSLSYLYNDGTGYLNFNIDSKSNKLKIPLSPSLLKRKKWIKVRIDFNLAADKVNITINNAVYSADKLGLKNKITASLIFGKNPLYTEVPRMAIKNLSVGDDSKQYFFQLDEWSGNNVHDADKNIIGYVENPAWLTKESYFWKAVYMHTFKAVAGLNFDPLSQNIFILSKDSLITYNSEQRTATSHAYKNKMPVQMVLGKSIFNTKENKCYTYEVFDIKNGMPSIAALNMNENDLQWETIGKATLPNQLHHHNIFYNTREDTIYLFGGYGSYSYHNTFFYYDKQADKWQPIIFKGDRISPRFFSAIGPSDQTDEIFLFGGYGNESGNQVVGGKQYYDLYRINLNKHTIKKCWEIHPDSSVFVPANNLILSTDKKFFYALCYPHEVAKTQLALYKFSIRDGTYEIASAPIPVTSERIESDINLFYSDSTGEFFCTTQEFTDRNNSTTKIFSLEAPPLSRTLYMQSLKPEKKTTNVFVYAIIAGLLSAIVVLILYRKSKTKNQKLNVNAPEPVPVQTGNIENDSSTFEINAEEIKQNAVYVLGEFLVYDKNSRDITHLFSPKIKQLFILILLNSINSNGISSRKISAVLWPEKDVSKTKNIKGVTFNHLRNALSDVNGLELCFTGDNYCFKLSDYFFCDYCEVSKLFNEHTNNLSFKESHLVFRGNLLKDMHEPWLEDFKYDYEKRLISLLNPQLKKLYLQNDLKATLEISRFILSIEPFNDEALSYELITLKKLKGNDYAKKVFDQFSEEYKRSLGEDYPLSFEKLISNSRH